MTLTPVVHRVCCVSQVGDPFPDLNLSGVDETNLSARPPPLPLVPEDLSGPPSSPDVEGVAVCSSRVHSRFDDIA